MIYFNHLKGDMMKNLVAEKVKKNNDKIKLLAKTSKKLASENIAEIKQNQPSEIEIEKKVIMKESKTLMLD